MPFLRSTLRGLLHETLTQITFNWGKFYPGAFHSPSPVGRGLR